MITKELIQGRINHLKLELKVLQDTHNHMVNEHQQREAQFQQQLVMNQCRFQQINGAISQLSELLNQSKEETKNDNTNGSDAAVGAVTRGIFDPDCSAGHHLRTPVGNRGVDQPHPAPGETGPGNRIGGPYSPMGG